MAAKKPSLQQWASELTQQQMPAFAQTAHAVANQASDSESSAADLAAKILQDVSMTTRLLRMANSIFFNPQGGRISTISRAVVVLGFEAVRDLCLSIALIDTFKAGGDRDKVAERMAMAFHAALQARKLAEWARVRDPEEVFIATLLSHLGDLALLCFGERLNPELHQQLLRIDRAETAQRDRSERELLGFPIRELTAMLNREWRLSSLLATSLDPAAAKDDRSQILNFGNQLAEAMLGGTQDPRLEALLERIARNFSLDREELRNQVWKTADLASDTMAELGAPQAAKRVPTLPKSVKQSAAPVPAPVPASPSATRWNENDSQLQLAVLRELSQLLLESRASVGTLMDMVLEGIFRGVGMDRAIFALLTPDRAALRSKACLLSEGAELPVEFEFSLGAKETHPFKVALQNPEPIWLGQPGGRSWTLDPRSQRISEGNAFIMALMVGSTAIGCLYADRQASRRPLNEDLFTQFKLFGQQARLGLSFIKSR